MSNNRRPRRQRRAMGEINMVPFIDVMLVLLVIFMVTAPLITTGDIDLPTVSKAPAAKDDPSDVLTLSIRADASYQLTSKRAGVLATDSDIQPMLTAILGKQQDNPSIPVVIAADQTLSYATVMTAMDALRQHEVQQVGLSVAQQP